MDRDYEVVARNVAGDSAAAGPVTGRVDHHQPDAHLRRSTEATWVGEDVHNADGAGQARTAPTRRGATTRFVVRLTDDGTAADTFTVRAPAGTTAFRTRYVDVATGADVTAAVVAGTHVADDGDLLRVEVRVGTGVAVGRTRTILVTAAATLDPTAVDAVKATVRATT